jgi:hypothetical protein
MAFQGREESKEPNQIGNADSDPEEEPSQTINFAF